MLSAAVRRWYGERIFGPGGRGEVPQVFRPLAGAMTGRAVVEGCRGGGRNILEVRLRVAAGRIEALQMACNLCSPPMVVAADILGSWVLGREAEEILGLDAGAEGTLTPWFDVLGAPERPADAGEKFRYVLWAVQNALRQDRGEPSRPVPEFEASSSDGRHVPGDDVPGDDDPEADDPEEDLQEETL